MFYAAAHQRIAAAIYDMHAAGRKVDLVLLTDELRRRDELQEIGEPGGGETGAAVYVLKILETVPHAAHAMEYAALVRSAWRKRILIESSIESIQDAYGGEDGETIWERAESRMFRLSDQTTKAGEAESISTLLEQTFAIFAEREVAQSIPGVKTGFDALDDILGAL